MGITTSETGFEPANPLGWFLEFFQALVISTRPNPGRFRLSDELIDNSWISLLKTSLDQNFLSGHIKTHSDCKLYLTVMSYLHGTNKNIHKVKVPEGVEPPCISFAGSRITVLPEYRLTKHKTNN